MSNHKAYFEYLQGRSITGLIYRRWWLYPKLRRCLSGRVLDVGCGLGDMLAYRPNTVGVDINPETVEWCRSRGLDAHLMTTEVLPFADGEFSGVLLDNVLEHLVEPAPLLMEIHRVLAPAGRLVVGVPGRRGYASDPDHKVFYDGQTLNAVLSQSGFQCRQQFFMPLQWVWLDARARQYCLYGIFERQ